MKINIFFEGPYPSGESVKHRLSSFVLLTCLVALIAGTTVFGGCVGTQNSTNPSIERITVTGSTTVLPLVEKAKEAFDVQHPDTDIQISGGGSSVGIKAVGEGTADIGMSSRDIQSSEQAAYPNLIKHEIAFDAILLIVNPANSIDHLTLAQIRGIYNGTYTNWNQVGGADQPIVVVGRDSASGTREYFSEVVMMKENFTLKQEEFNSNGGIQQKIMQTPGAIGYVGLAFTDGVKAVKLEVNGVLVEPTADNVLDGNYPISRPLYLFTRGQPTGLAKNFIDFILSPDGQKVVEEAGFVPLM